MAEPIGESLAATLLGTLPASLAESLLARLGNDADRLRPVAKSPPANEVLDRALSTFFDIERILDRGARQVETTNPPAEAIELVVAPPPVDPISQLKALSTDRILRAIEGEPPSAIVHVLSCLDLSVAGAILKGLPPDVRSEVAVRFSHRGPKNFALVTAIARVIAEKAKAILDQPESESTDRVADVAMMLRSMPRAERLTLLQSIDESDPELATQLRAKLFRFEDVLKIEDKPLQQILGQINLRTLATALKSAEPIYSEKILRNISAKAREQFGEETEVLGTVSSSKSKEAQAEILNVIRRFEEEGKFTLEE